MSFGQLKKNKPITYDDIVILDRMSFTYERTWKDVIFLPFNKAVQYLHLLVMLITIHINLYIMCFRPMMADYYDLLFHIMEWIYCLHTMLLICHRLMKRHRIRRSHPPDKWVFITMDIISSIPLQDCYVFVQHFKWVPTDNQTVVFYATLLKLFRILRILCKFKEYDKDPSIEKKFTITLFHFIISSIVTHIMVCCYYAITCLECGFDNLTRYTSYFTFNNLNDNHWLVVLYTYVHLVVLHNYWGALINATFAESLLAIMCLTTGLVMRYIFMLGNMIAVYIRALRYQFWFKQELIWVNSLMSLLNFDEKLTTQIREYYDIIWKEYKGINQPPSIVNMFPAAMRRDISIDVYWEAVMHTHIFADYDVSVRREICSIMETEIRMPGELVFNTGKNKSKMIYIVSGIIELHATENVGAPIMFFKSGTILGEISCAFPTISMGTFKCCTTCHLHVLHYTNMHKLYRNKPKVHKDIMNTIKERIKFAKIKRVFLINAGVDVNASHIGWIKHQWHAIALAGQNEDDENDEELYNECYSSRFLDLLVLTMGKEWRKDLICLRDKCPLIMQRNSSFRSFLYYLNLIVIALQFLITAKMIGFDQRIDPNLYPLILILDLFYFLDLYVQVITVPKVPVAGNRPSDIMLYRSRQMMFLFDVVATVPYDYFASFFQLSSAYTACLRAPRFLKLYKLVIYFIELEFNVNIGNLYITKFTKFMVLHGILIMTFVCIDYFYSCMGGNCDGSWIYWNRELVKFVTGFEYEFDDYLDTFHHLLSVYLGFKVSNRNEVTMVELVYHAFVATVGFYVAMFCFVQLAAVICLLNEFKRNFLLDMDVLNEITDRKDLLHLKSKIINFANVQWNLNKNQTLKNIYTVMGQESVYLRKIVTTQYVMKAFQMTELFVNSNPRFLKQLAYNSRLLVIPEGHLIYDSNYKMYYLYLIVEGNCMYHSLLPSDDDKNIEKVFNKNTCFPVVTIFQELRPLVRVQSITTVILMCIPYLTIKQLLRAFPAEGEIFRKTCEIHKMENEGVMLRNPVHASQGDSKQMGVKVPTFNYSTEKSCDKISFYYGLTSMEKFVRKLVYTTYDPNGRPYLYYEIYRSITILIPVIVTLSAADVAFYHCLIGRCKLILMLFWWLGLIDIYIRGHVQYYNEQGVKVTKLSKTFKHYVETSFTIDFLSTFPYQLFGIIGIFYSNPMRAYLIIMLIVPSLSLYRPAKLFAYIKNTVNPKYHIWYDVIGAISIGIVFIVTTAHVKLVIATDTVHGNFNVPETSWISMHTSLENLKGDHLYLIIYYVVSSMTITHTFTHFGYHETLKQLFLVMYIYIMKLLFMTYVVGSEAYGNVKLAKHQDAIRDYIGFTSKKLISNADKEEMIAHISNYWKKSNGESPKLIFENFSPYMKEEIFLSLYKGALHHSFFFHDGEESLYRLMVYNLDERHYKKDADIIRVNDVEDTVYIVASGHVNVYIADLYQLTLRTGGIFGSFSPRGCTRLTVRVTASVHVKILCMKTTYLYEIATIYKIVHARIINMYVENREYIKDVADSQRQKWDDSSNSTSRSRSHNTKVRDRVGWFFVTVKESNIYYRIWDYLSNVHIVAVSSTYCLYVLVVDNKIVLLWLWILLDVFFLGHIYIRTHSAYTDLESGVIVTQFEQVALRYVKSIKFYVDAISILPLYAISYLVKTERKSIFLTNKFFRVCNLYTYYHSFVVRKNVPRHLQWTFLLYNTLFLLQVVFDVWYLVADYDDDIKEVKSYLRVFSIYTSAGLSESEFETEAQLLVNLVLIYVTQGLLIYMMVVITRLLVDYNFTVSMFKISGQLFMTYCQNENLSKPLADRVWTYLMYLFLYHRGRQDPILFETAPSYIIQNHKASLYGHLIEMHPPFSSAHIDFLRQLFQCTQVAIYLPGDMIVEVGDCNSTMYFIEEGEVISIEELHNSELVCDVLTSGVFGVEQGLSKMEYTKTYKAMTVCSIISVCKRDWAYLLEFFPATEQIINEMIRPASSSSSMAFSEKSSNAGSNQSLSTIFSYDNVSQVFA